MSEDKDITGHDWARAHTMSDYGEDDYGKPAAYWAATYVNYVCARCGMVVERSTAYDVGEVVLNPEDTWDPPPAPHPPLGDWDIFGEDDDTFGCDDVGLTCLEALVHAVHGGLEA